MEKEELRESLFKDVVSVFKTLSNTGITFTDKQKEEIKNHLESYETSESFKNQTDQEILSDLKNGTSFGMK